MLVLALIVSFCLLAAGIGENCRECYKIEEKHAASPGQKDAERL